MLLNLPFFKLFSHSIKAIEWWLYKDAFMLLFPITCKDNIGARSGYLQPLNRYFSLFIRCNLPNLGVLKTMFQLYKGQCSQKYVNRE